ncbi:hypothetical protein HNR25_005172 [Streptomonospora salina]|uniref:FCS-type domain-containing protein n=1 Tax=Streptomonospora salina TaxID=104205 RepID=A0A841EPI3_9ACTN|nr:hypothetical protein [Streptomonospora salina]MBB6001341.1 hypothetical protein [Streptomonospora salina]
MDTDDTPRRSAAPAAGRDHTTEQPVLRECAWCGAEIHLTPRARHQIYCSRSCRQRAYELRTAQERRDADAAAGRARSAEDGPVREVVERHTVRVHTRTRSAPVRSPKPAAPAGAGVDLRARAVQAHLEAVAAAVADGRIRSHDHDRVWRGMRALMNALDSAHPGGLDALTGRR